MARKAAAADGDADAGPGPSSMRQYALAHTLSGHKHAVSCVAFAPGDKLLLASASADQTLALWDARSGQRLASGGGGGGGGGVMAHAQGVNCVAWNPQACYLASASDDLTAKLWDVETGACLRTLAGHTNYVFCCQFDPVGHILATGSFDETVRFWDVRSGRCLREIPAHSDPVTCLSFNHDGTLLVTSSYDGLVRLWDASTGACLKTLPADANNSPVGFATFSPNGKYVLQATLDSTLRLVNYAAGKPAKKYMGHKATEYCSTAVFVTNNGARPLIAGGSEDGGLYVWDVDSKEVVQQVAGRVSSTAPGEGHKQPVLYVAGHDTAPLLATASKDKTIKIWSAEPPADAAAV